MPAEAKKQRLLVEGRIKFRNSLSHKGNVNCGLLESLVEKSAIAPQAQSKKKRDGSFKNKVFK